MNRRDLLALLGLGAAGAAGAASAGRSGATSAATPVGGKVAAAAPATGFPPFQPVALPLPVPSDGLTAVQQRRSYRDVVVEDRLLVPDGFRADVLAAWGDRLGEGRFGFNNDYLAFTPLRSSGAAERPEALLTVNFEYISLLPWSQGYREATGEAPLPLPQLIDALRESDGRIDALSLAADDPLRRWIDAVATAALMDLGIGVAGIRRGADGRWHRQSGPRDRRITGLSGLRDPSQRLRVSGPAGAVFRAERRLGFDDGLGDRIIGTFANCAGGTTPWGTVLSAEENVQDQICEAVHADGSSPHPAERPFRCDGRRLEGLGNPFGLAGNKYGWMVEIDPLHPARPAIKHSWLGRFRHEAVAVRATVGQPLIVYSGCDRHGGHLYRFVSAGVIVDPKDPANSLLFEAGRLEVARFRPDGLGEWLPLAPGTAVDPQGPGHFAAFGVEQPTLVPHRDRTRAGSEALPTDGDVEAYRRAFPTLATLYPGAGERRMGAILIDAHLAANAIGASPTARPEDTVIDPGSGDLLIAFTAGGGSEDGHADPAIFRGPEGETVWPHGWIMRLEEEIPRRGGGADAADRPGAAGMASGGADAREISPKGAGPEGALASRTFRWRMVAMGGAPWEGGLGFSNPDNLAVDQGGNIWMVTDRSTRTPALEVFGNNSCWVLPQGGAGDGAALCFAVGPMECELTGPCFDSQDQTLFLSVQHPGENHGARLLKDGVAETTIRNHSVVDRQGNRFEQRRRVPVGSNWPSGVPGRTPRPAIVAIRRSAGGPLLGH